MKDIFIVNGSVLILADSTASKLRRIAPNNTSTQECTEANAFAEVISDIYDIGQNLKTFFDRTSSEGYVPIATIDIVFLDDISAEDTIGLWVSNIDDIRKSQANVTSHIVSDKVDFIIHTRNDKVINYVNRFNMHDVYTFTDDCYYFKMDDDIIFKFMFEEGHTAPSEFEYLLKPDNSIEDAIKRMKEEM